MSFVYVSMTSIPSRLPRLLPVIHALLTQQSFLFHKFFLYLPFYCTRLQTAYEIPQKLIDLQSDRFEIRRVSEDCGPATKVLPAMLDLLEAKNCSCVISVDDDVFLEAHAMEELVFAHQRDPHAVIGFMGVIAPHFFHGDLTVAHSFEVQLLGGYRAILYPWFVFGSYLRLFDHMRQQLQISETKLPWPFSVTDDDYLFACFAHVLHIPLKVIHSQFRCKVDKLNFRFYPNSDGVTAQKGSNCYIQRSRDAIDSVMRSFPMPDVRMLHIICNSPHNTTRILKKNKNTKIVTLPEFDAGMPDSLVISFLKCLFHPHIHVIEGQKYFDVDYVLISSWRYVMDVKRIHDVARWHARMRAFNPPKRQMEIGFCDVDIIGGFCAPLLLTMQDVQNVISCAPHDKAQLASRIISWVPKDLQWPNTKFDNLKSCGCVYVSHIAHVVWFESHCAKRESPQEVQHVFYGTKNITKNLREVCSHTTSFQIEGSNAQMDNLFGDPAPNVRKSIFIQMHDGNIMEQNTDWKFWLENDRLMVQ